MAIDQERVKNNIVRAEVDGDTLKFAAVPHVVTESEESRRKNRDVLADRATIAGAAERGFMGRMWYGLTETYQRLRRRDALRELHDNGNDINLGSAALERAKDQVREMITQERDEITATAISRNISNDVGEGDSTWVLDEDTAGSERQEEIVAWARSIVSEYATGQIDQARMRELSENLSCELRDELPDLFTQTTIGSDLTYIAEAAKTAYVANQERIKAVDLDLQICFGQVDAGMATAEKRDLADRLVDWAQGSRARAVLVNPLTIGASASAIAVGAKAPFRSIPVIGGIAGGAFAAARRWSKENKDRDLRIREEEIGYDVPGPARHTGVERVLSGLVGQTDFRETSYQPRAALEVTEQLEQLAGADAAEKQTQAWRDNAINLLADTRVRLAASEELGVGLIRYGRIRGEDGQVEVTGISTINQDRLALILAARETQRQLVSEIGQADFDQRYEATEDWVMDQVADQYEEADSRFFRSKLLMSARSGAFGFGVGVLGGLGIHEIGEGIEHVSRKVADVFHQAHEQRMVPDQKDVSLGHGNVINADGTNVGHQGLQVDVASGVNAHLDAAKHTLSVDVPANGADAAKHFEIAYQPGMTQDQIHAALVKAGLEGKVDILHSGINVPSHLSTDDILKQDYLAQHHLVDVTNQPHGIDFGHAQFLGDRHEYNELTLYQHDATHWSMGPHGLDGSALKPFVYKNEPAWADPSIVSNAPVNPDSLVAFYQITDAHGQLHTVLAPQTGGHFTLPQEFVDPATGKVDGVSIIGYGMVKDAHGKLIDGNQVLTHPELMNGATLHSMASVAVEQKGHMIAGTHVDMSTVKISDLTAHVPGSHPESFDVPNKFVFDIPPIATPFAPRLFPKIAEAPGVTYGEYPEYLYGEIQEPDYGEQLTEEEIARRQEDQARELLGRRLSAQESYLTTIRDKYSLDNQSNRSQIMLQRLNGRSKGYLDELEEVNRSLPPMSEKARMTVVIPAFNEEAKIEKTLRSWINQQGFRGDDFDPEQIEVIVLVNRPNSNTSFDRTRQVIEGLKREPSFAGFAIHVVEKTFNFQSNLETVASRDGRAIKVLPGVRMGMVYKYAADLALLRNASRKDQERKASHLIRTGGADVFGRNPYFASRVFSVFEDNPALEQYVSRSDYHPSIYRKLPLLHFAQRLNEMMNLQYTRRKSNIGLGTYRMAIYAEAGGFDPGKDIREEIDLSYRIRKIIEREEKQGIKARERQLVVNALDDPRRAIATIWAGKPITQLYDSWADQEVRRIDVADVLKKRVPKQARLTKENVEKQVEAVFRFYFRYLLDSPSMARIPRKQKVLRAYNLATRYLNRSLKVLGVDNYEISHKKDLAIEYGKSDRQLAENISVSVKDISELKRLVKRYPKRKRPEWIERVGLKRGHGFVEAERGKMKFLRAERIVRRSLGLSDQEFEEAAKIASKRSSAEQERRPLYEWVVLLHKAKELGEKSEDLDELSDLPELLKARRTSAEMHQKLTKHAAVAAIARMSREPVKVGRVASLRTKVVQSVPVVRKVAPRTS